MSGRGGRERERRGGKRVGARERKMEVDGRGEEEEREERGG